MEIHIGSSEIILLFDKYTLAGQLTEAIDKDCSIVFL